MTKREHALGIWALGLGYFIFYMPYSAFIKAITTGLLFQKGHFSGLALLPAAVISTALMIPLFITAMGWWKYRHTGEIFGALVRLPSLHTFLSGICFATIIATTTLAYSFKGISIIFALLLMRSGTLIMGPLVDRAFGRKVRWFSWVALAFSLTALAVALLSLREYQLSKMAFVNLAAYLAAYALRLPCMTKIAKTRDKQQSMRYFVEEQMVAMPVLVLVPVIVALTGPGMMTDELRLGFTQLFNISFVLPGIIIGILYAGLGIFSTFIFLDRRENTFCIPMQSCSSILAGIAASYVLTWSLHATRPTRPELAGASLMIVALLVLSPLHHLPLYIKQFREAVKENRLVIISFIGTRSAASQLDSAARSRFITVDFQAMRHVLKTHNVDQ